MYPYELFLGLDLYSILLCVGILACLIIFRVYADKIKVPARLQNLVLYSAVVGILVGYAGSVLMQSIYHYIETGEFVIAGTTFYGGLIFGALSFLAVYFIGGNYAYKKTDHPKLEAEKFIRISDIAACSITAAHGFGRLGCLMAGCCYGLVFDEPHWYTATFVNTSGEKMYALPTQLYEAIFLFLICVYLSTRIFRKKSYNLSIYMIVYGVWRFAIEYIRADDRGETIVSFLTPSQLVAILMVIGGIVLIFVFRKLIANNPGCLTFDGTEGEKKLVDSDLDEVENDSDDSNENEDDDERDDVDDDDDDDDDSDD